MIVVNDKMQTGYSYECQAPEGRHFAPDFKPELSPKEMLALGVFEGHYLTDCRAEFPSSWFDKAKNIAVEALCCVQLFWHQIAHEYATMATARLDYRARSARLVSVVLQVLCRAAYR